MFSYTLPQKIYLHGTMFLTYIDLKWISLLISFQFMIWYRLLVLSLCQILSCFMRRTNLRVRRQTSVPGPLLSEGRATSWWQPQLMEKWLLALPWISRIFVHVLIYHYKISRKFHTHLSWNIKITEGIKVKIKTSWAGEMTQQSWVLNAYCSSRTQLWFPAPMSGGSRRPSTSDLCG